VAQNELAIELREGKGKGVARKLRATGRIPGVFYGRGEPHSISLDPRALEMRGGGLDGSQALLKELQRDPVRGTMVHADLFAIDLAKKIQVSVPIHLTGSAKGVLMGGIIDHSLREIEFECLPRAIPEEILADVTELDVGMTLHVRDLPLPQGVELLSDADLSVVSVVLPAAAEEAAPEGEELAEGVVPAEGEAPEGGPEGDEAKESD
jgi:large subunit ribosomal protein L25